MSEAATTSADSSRGLEGADRACELERPGTQACAVCGQPAPPTAPDVKKQKTRQHKRHKDGGFLRRSKQQAAAAEEAIERGQADVEAAQAEAAACEKTLGVTSRALKVASSQLKRVHNAATSLRPWCSRTSTQAVRYVDEPRALVVMRGVFDEDFCDSAAVELRTKRHWVLQGGDAREGGGYSALRHQLDLPKPSGHEKYAQIVRQFSEVLHFTAKSHNHLCNQKLSTLPNWKRTKENNSKVVNNNVKFKLSDKTNKPL